MTDPAETSRIAAVAVAAARAAGEVQMAHFGRALNVDEARRHDIKLEVDRLSEQAIVEAVRASFPGHSVLAEEGGLSRHDGRYVWIIDPLDGTVNYFYGLPWFCASVACYRAPEQEVAEQPCPRGLESLGEPVAAVVYAAATDELFAAERGAGATKDGEAIQVSAVAELAEAIVATGFGTAEDGIRHWIEGSRRTARRARKVRCMGAAGYDLANVAAGRLTAFFERGLRTWDIAAGRLLIEEAGGRFEAEEYAPGRWEILATNGKIHEALKEVLGE